MVDWSHPNKHFLEKIFDIISIYLLTHFSVPNFQKILQEAQDYEDAAFLDPKCASFPKRKFFRNLLINLVPIIHLYLYSKNESQISIY